MDRKATGLPLIEGTRHIVEAMQRHGVRRYVGNVTPSILDPRERPTWQTRLPTSMAKTFLPRTYDEIVGMSQAVTSSGLDWTIVRFLAPQGRSRRGEAAEGLLRHRQAWLRRHPRRHRRLHRRPGRRPPLHRRGPSHQQLTERVDEAGGMTATLTYNTLYHPAGGPGPVPGVRRWPQRHATRWQTSGENLRIPDLRF